MQLATNDCVLDCLDLLLFVNYHMCNKITALNVVKLMRLLSWSMIKVKRWSRFFKIQLTNQY
jgi:hypothetical protein